MDFIQRAAQAILPPLNTRGPVITTAVITAVTTAFLCAVLSRKRPAVLRSPLGTQIARLSPEEKSQLLYPPDYFPGARDVPTPFGDVRCCTYRQAPFLAAGSHPLPVDLLRAHRPPFGDDEMLTCLDEFGPKSGRKVLLVHGISTSCSKWLLASLALTPGHMHLSHPGAISRGATASVRSSLVSRQACSRIP